MTLTAADLEAEADRLEEQARHLEQDAIHRGAEYPEAQVRVLRRQAHMLRLASRELSLHSPADTTNVKPVLTQEHKLAISEGVHKYTHGQPDPFMAHIKGRGWTLTKLVKDKSVRWNTAGISQARRPKGDPLHRPIRRWRADAIEKLTGWPADSWPRVRD